MLIAYLPQFLIQFQLITLFETVMDVGLLAPSLFSVNFMPSSPPLALNGVQPWPEDLNFEFMDMVCKNKANCLLTPLKRSDYWYYLNNRTAISQALDKAQRQRQAYDKH